MQEKIAFTPPQPVSSAQQAAPQVSQVLLTKVMDYLETLSETEKLQAILKIARNLQHEQIQRVLDGSLAKSSVEDPAAEAIWKNVSQQLQTGKTIIHPLLKQLIQNAKDKNTQEFAKNLQELANYLLEPGPSKLSLDMEDVLEEMTSDLAEKGGDTPAGSLSQTILKGFLGSKLALLKNQNASEAEMKSFILDALKKQAQATPPTPFTKAASQFLQAGVIEKFMEQLIKKWMHKIEQERLHELEKLLKDPLNNEALQQSLVTRANAFQETVAPKELYGNYQDAIKAHMGSKFSKEATKNSVQKEISFLQQLLQELEKVDPNHPQIQESASMLSQITKNFPNLSNSELKNLTIVMDDLLSNFPSLSKNRQTALLKQLKTMMNEMKQTGSASISQYQPLITGANQRLAHLDGLTASLGEIQTLLQQLVNGQSFTPQIAKKIAQASSLLMQQSSQLSPKEQEQVKQLCSHLSTLKSNDPASLKKTWEFAAPTVVYFEKNYLTVQGESEGLTRTQEKLKRLNALADGATQEVDNKAMVGGSSLPDQFSNVILSKSGYMARQEAYLEEVAQTLYFLNFGTGMDNQFLNEIPGWQNAGNNYGFTNWYNSGGVNSGQSGIQSQMNNEINQANADKTAAQKLQGDIQAKLQEIQQEVDSGKLTQAQANQLEGPLNSELSSVTQAITNLQNLISDLTSFEGNVGPIQGQGLPTQDVTKLQQDENAVVKGDPSTAGSGGLTTIYSAISIDQGQWSSLSQTQQTMLEMRMTQIQQEWTVVSTALQMLNQMYMTPAQAIYK